MSGAIIGMHMHDKTSTTAQSKDRHVYMTTQACHAGPRVVVYYCRTYMKAVRGGGVKRGDVCYGMLRAAACVDESDHHALMYVWHGQIVREDRVGEASARRP